MTEYTNASVAKGRRLRIVLPGGTGHLGTILARQFASLGHSVTVLSRTPTATPWRVVKWDGENIGNWTAELDGADVVINLAGRSVDCRYGAVHRREIMTSRIGSTRILGEAIRQLGNPPRLWMNSSTATIYRHSLDRAMDEATGELGGNERGVPSIWRFSIEVAKAWEASFFGAETLRTRKIALRSAMVMSPERGGPFEALLRLVQLGMGGAAGAGTQFVSWVHESDFVRALEYLIRREDIEGVVNVAAPNPLPNREFMHELRAAWGANLGLAAPKWALEVGAIFLRTETELILKSRRVIPGRLLDRGFQFEFPEWGKAARNLVQLSRNGKARCGLQEIRRPARDVGAGL